MAAVLNAELTGQQWILRGRLAAHFYEVRPRWTDDVSAGDIVLAGKNFGVGSSRPVAALFAELGVAGLVAEELNSLFFRNAVNAGLPAMTLPDATTIFSDGDVGTFDLSDGNWRNENTGAAGTSRSYQS